MKKISVIIPTYNRAEMLRVAIDSLIQQDLAPEDYEIIVVDNNSTDETREVIEELGRKSLVAVKYLLETRQGVHYARNSAINVSEAEILYYTDDDIITDKRALSEVLKPFVDSTVGSTSGKVLPKWEIEPPEWVVKYFGGGYLSLIDYGDKSLVLDRPNIWSCHLAIRKDLLIKCGGFNPENTAGIWIGDGETGLLKKVLNNGCKIIYTPEAVVYHIIPSSRLTQKYMNVRLYNQGACDSYSKYKEDRFSNKTLFYTAFNELLLSGKKWGGALIRRILKKESWHVYRTKASYWYSRFIYDFRLATRADMRELVLRDDWLC